MKILYRSENRTTKLLTKEGIPFLSYSLFEGYPVANAISTRLGGVSEGCFASMNMSYTRGDDPSHVSQNHVLFARAAGYDEKRLMMSDQIHETTIRRVEEKDVTDGVRLKGVDGLMTDVPGLALMTFYADCVPLLFYDKKRGVIAMAHSGWRGTVKKIGQICLSRMGEEYGTDPADVLCAIGPSICQSCYEVDEPVLAAFRDVFGKESDAWFLPQQKEGHYLLDLASACRHTLMDSGVPRDQIAMPDLCTCCNPELLFSHRINGDKRGNLSVVMYLLPKKGGPRNE